MALPATVWILSPSFIRTARKVHRCHRWTRVGETDERAYCERPIEVGSRYVEYLGETAGYQSGKRYHLDCARLQGVLYDERPIWHTGNCAVPWTQRDTNDATGCPCGGEPAPYFEAVP